VFGPISGERVIAPSVTCLSHKSPAIAAVVTLTLGASAFAAEITLAAADAGKELPACIDEPFSTATGHRIKATFDTVGAQRELVERAS